MSVLLVDQGQQRQNNDATSRTVQVVRSWQCWLEDEQAGRYRACIQRPNVTLPDARGLPISFRNPYRVYVSSTCNLGALGRFNVHSLPFLSWCSTNESVDPRSLVIVLVLWSIQNKDILPCDNFSGQKICSGLTFIGIWVRTFEQLKFD